MEDYIALLNEANRNLGLINAEITAETISTLSGLSEAQQRALFDQLYLIAEQRGHENIFNAEMNNFRAFIIDISTEFGWTIEDYMLEVLEGVTPQWINDDEYTDAEQAQNLVKDYEQRVKGSFHSRRFAKQFPTTIRDYEYKKSFYPSKVGAFIDRKVSMLNTSAEIYLQNSVLIDEIKQMITDGDLKIKNGYSVNNSNGILKMLEDIKTDYTAFSTPVSLYNADNVISITPYDELKFLVTKQSVLNRIKVREYSAAFNLDQMKLEGRIITVPEDYDFAQVEGEDVLAVLLDRRSIVVAIKMWKMGSFYVANQYKTNHWLGVEGVRGHNRFINAVAYTGETLGNFLDEGETPSSTVKNIPVFSHGELIEDVSSVSLDGEIVTDKVGFVSQGGYTYGYYLGTASKTVGFNSVNDDPPEGDDDTIYVTFIDGAIFKVTDAGDFEGEWIIDIEQNGYYNPNEEFTPFEKEITAVYFT